MQKLQTRFEQYAPIPRDNGCLDWPLAQSKSTGYGSFWFDRKPIYAHRVAYLLAHGPISEDQMVRHSCDNRMCINPRHLSIGSARDNIQDMVDRERQARGSRDGNAKLNEEQVAEIWRELYQGTGKTALARRYEVTRQTIWAIETKRTWAHLTSTLGVERTMT